MENFESQQFRDDLATDLKESPEEDRSDILEQSKKTKEYWQARESKIRERQEEEEIDDGLGILLKNKTLYHGSPVGGIQTFNKAEDATVGNGLYLTSDAEDAIGYAGERVRDMKNLKKTTDPVIYEVLVENLKMCDLRKDDNVIKIAEGFKKFLLKELERVDLKWYVQGSYIQFVQTINRGHLNGVKLGAGTVKLIAQQAGQVFSDYIKSLGYDGLIAFEGGEGNIGNHDTYLIFDPEKAKINKENKVEEI